MRFAIPKLWLSILIAVAFALPSSGQFSSPPPDWKPLSWLIGDWSGSGAGGPGQGSGAFSFHPDLQDQILIRKNHAEYPATANKPAYRHDDLMIIYADGKNFRANYFDTEGHVIRYRIEASADTIRFTSDESAPGPRFRLTYHKKDENTLTGMFEIASQTKPNDFSKYLEWSAQKQSGK
jgi:hypothetical protein